MTRLEASASAAADTGHESHADQELNFAVPRKPFGKDQALAA